MTKQVKIMRGISGAGKSTCAKVLVSAAAAADRKGIICSADKFFVDHNGYNFDINNLGEAHNWCMREFIRALQDDMDLVIVDNTNIAIEDISPYVAVGRAFDYEVEIIQVNTSPEVAAARNVHQVPIERVLHMYKRLHTIKLPRRFKVTQINP
jgi:predicted kinase